VDFTPDGRRLALGSGAREAVTASDAGTFLELLTQQGQARRNRLEAHASQSVIL
jgi:hypothetical protein